ncbi:RHO1 GDP-GTP exchange protein 2 [Tulasnella sp. 417]|nr:RHO1 GDP-GTP exchange protein 2 [Tulasnella sp. 417]
MYTPNDNPDKAHLVKVVKVIHELLGRVLQESRKTEARVALLQLEQQLVFSKGEQVDLRLRDNNRKLLYQGTLKRQGGQRDNREMQVFLLDHALLMVKPNTTLQQLYVYKRPIPLEFLVVEAQEESIDQNTFASAREPSNRDEYPINFTYLGRNGYVLTLWASSVQGREKWLEAIAKQQALVREAAMKFGTLSLTATFFNRWNKVNCAAPFADGHRIAYGTERGVYFSDTRHREEAPEHVLDLGNVVQVNVVIECELLVVLSERSVITVPLDALDARNPKAGLKRAKTVSSDASFFKLGTCLGRTLLCVVNTSAVASTIKVLEPIDQAAQSKSKLILKKLLPGGNDALKVFKEFDIPIGASSLHLLKTRLCLGYAEGFQVIDLGTSDMAPLLDPADRSLDLVQPGVRVNNTSPTAIYLIENEFLLCYNEFAFYVDKNGRRAPLYYPYVLAFEQTFIEVHNVTTSQLVQMIPGKDLHCLFADTPPSIAQSSANSKTRLLQLLEHRPNLFIAGLSEQSPYTRDEIIIVSDDNVMTVELALFS